MTISVNSPMLTNAEIKQINSLSQKKYRQKYGQFVIEGARLVGAAAEAGLQFDRLYVSTGFAGSNDNGKLALQLHSSGYQWEIAEERQLGKLSETVSPSGIFAVCPLPTDPSPPAPESCPPGPWLYLDNISDPGNLGTLLRTAAWFGVNNIGLSADCVDPWNPKAVRSGMGAHFTVSLYSSLDLAALKDCGMELLGADMAGKPVSNFNPQLREKWCLVIGSEAHGLSAYTRNLLETNVSIPRIGSGESLNAATAASVLLYALRSNT